MKPDWVLSPDTIDDGFNGETLEEHIAKLIAEAKRNEHALAPEKARELP